MDQNNSRCLEIQKAISREQIRSCYKVAKELRLHITSEDAFVEQIERQLTQGYHLIYYSIDNEVKAVAGYRFLEFLSWGKVLYIDDLITDPKARRKGYGGMLLNWLINEARKKGCDQVHLDSGHHRFDAHKLYLRHGFKITCHHFGLDFKDL
jgi:GNAT superfamily N-acetyltransferase